MAEMKYKTLAELQQAYASGELTAPLMLDNDWVGVYDDGEKVYASDPWTLQQEALKLLGIPSEHV